DGLVANVATAPEIQASGIFVPRKVDHDRNVGPVDVSIQKPDCQAAPRKREGQMERDRGFADAALPAADRDDVPRRTLAHDVRVARPATMSTSVDVSAGTSARRSRARAAAWSASPRAPSSPCART